LSCGNDQRPDLVLVTAAFPWGTAEQFLETEINYLAAGFRRVILVPSHVHGLERPLPQGVEAETSLGRAEPVGWRAAARAGLSLAGLGAAYLEPVKRPAVIFNREALKRMALFGLRARLVSRWLAGFLPRAGLDPGRTVFYTYWLGPATWGLGLAKRAQPGLRLVSRVHGGEIYEEQFEPPYLPFVRQAAAKADKILTVSDHGRRHLRGRFPFLEDRLEVCRLGVGDPGEPAEHSRDGILRIVTCAWLFPLKRLHLLVEGLLFLTQRRPDLAVEWTHFGDGPLRQDLERRVESGLASRVRLRILGTVPNSEVLSFYRTNPVDLLVNLSLSEGLPVSIMEALSFGVPVAATAVGGVPEVVNGRNGRLLSPNPGPEEIARALEEFSQPNPGVLAKRQASRETWRKLCRAEVNYPALCRKLMEVVDDRP